MHAEADTLSLMRSPYRSSVVYFLVGVHHPLCLFLFFCVVHPVLLGNDATFVFVEFVFVFCCRPDL